MPDRVRFEVVTAVLVVATLFSVLMTWKAQEPYPGLLMPSFPGSPLQDGEVRWTQHRVEALTREGDVLAVPVDELLPDTRVVRSAVVGSAFSAGLDEVGTPRPADRTRSPWERVLLGQEPAYTQEGTVRAYDPRTVDWLQTRMRALFPGRSVQEIRIVLEQHKADMDELERVTAEPIQEVRIRLQEQP